MYAHLLILNFSPKPFTFPLNTSILFGLVIICLSKIPTHDSSSVMFTFNFFIVNGNLKTLVKL